MGRGPNKLKIGRRATKKELKAQLPWWIGVDIGKYDESSATVIRIDKKTKTIYLEAVPKTKRKP